MDKCYEFLIYKENDKWRVACTDGRWYSGISGLYETKSEAIKAVGDNPYEVIEGRTTYELF